MKKSVRSRVADLHGDSSAKLITAIIPIYEAEKYLQETIDSVIAQSIGFSNNVHLVLVDDGSPDNSAEICQQYVDKYPQNISYVHQENAGVSAARNRGMQEVRGQYVHFLDSDDIISTDFYRLSVDFLEQHADDVDFVAPKIKFFDANIDEHPNNYKFHTTRVIDVAKEPDNPIMHVSSCFFVADALSGIEFDTRLKIAEDAKFVADVLEQKRKYGVLAKGCLYYRKRSDGSSAINGQFKNKSFYTATPRLFLEYLLDTWRDDNGKSADYAQCVVMYDLRWRLGQKEQSVLTEAEVLDYKNTLTGCIKQLDDRNIIAKKGMSLAKRLYILQAKYGDQWQDALVAAGGRYQVDSVTVCAAKDDSVHLDFVTVNGLEVKIEGYSELGVIDPGDRIVVRVGEVERSAIWVERKQREQAFLGERVYGGGAFELKVHLPSAEKQEIRFFRQLEDGSEAKLVVHTNRYTHLSRLPFSYRRDGDITFRKERGRLMVYARRWWRTIGFEVTYLGVIALNWRLRTVRERLVRLKRYNLTFLSPKQKLREMLKPFAFSVEAIAMIPKALLLRTLYHMVYPIRAKRKPIWLISDRGVAAGDNGEALYRYALDQSDVPASVYFVIAKQSLDYRRIKELGGKVLRQSSLKHQLLFLFADEVISSQADIETTNPYIRQLDHYVDLFKFDFVFLQHGIIRHDLSGWLNRFEKNIALFITSAEIEYQSVLRLPYYYTSQQVLLSGMPRYDLLENSPANKLIVAPTYRKDLVRKKTDKNGIRGYDPDFKHSEYRSFYNSLINDARIKKVLKDNNMQGELYLHPNFLAQTVDFDENEQFIVKEFPHDYKKAFSEGSVLVSDYSSVVFDFAFLKKPIVYSQFDQATFFDNQAYDRGDFFDDQADGFGVVATTLDGVAEEIARVIENDCKMNDKYKQRVDSFYRWNDRGASQRVYRAILAMDKQKAKEV